MAAVNERTMAPAEAAAYIENVSSELRDLAERNHLKFLAYLIDMARQEAALQAIRPAPRGLAGAKM
jgi:hypothetical protein